MGMTRREMLRAGILTGTGAAVASAAVVVSRARGEDPRDVTGEDSIRDLSVLVGVEPSDDEDALLRMQRELVRAMAKPAEDRRWIMAIDRRKCVGCHACTVSCIAENHLPPGVVYRPVVTNESGRFPNVKLEFTPRPCMQCDQPPCVPVCPVNATWMRADGVVVVDYDACIGCRYCLTACPYGARTADFGLNYRDADARGADGQAVAGKRGAVNEATASHEYVKAWNRQGHASPVGNARKCHFCLHKLEQGLLPSCTSTCIGRATFFGDANDPKSLVVELITKNHVDRLLPHLNTEPRVYYLG